MSPHFSELYSQQSSLIKSIFTMLFDQIKTAIEGRREQERETYKLQKRVKELTNENMKIQVQLKNRRSLLNSKP